MASNQLPRTALNTLSRQAFLHALKSVAPEQLISGAASLDESKKVLKIKDRFCSTHSEKSFDLTVTPSILIIGAGKATQELLAGLLNVLKDCKVPNLKVRAIANFPRGQHRISIPALPFASIELLEASHPIPDQSTIDSTNKQIESLYNCDPNTLVIVLLSGGGSALLETTHNFSSDLATNHNSNHNSISLDDLQIANKALIESGANITEINIIRKHFSQVKGGRLSQHAMASKNVKGLVGLYLSDVVGNDLSSVASGPTCPDKSTFEDCKAILTKYQLFDKLPLNIKAHLQKGIETLASADTAMNLLETPKPGNALFDNVFNVLIGSADTCALATQDYLKTHGISDVSIFSNTIDGEASTFGRSLTSKIAEEFLQKSDVNQNKSAFIGTGEFTVTIKGKGTGGRNQEMLLACLEELSAKTTTATRKIIDEYNFAILSCAFDGIEGNSPATGAVIDETSIPKLASLTLFSEDKLTKHIHDTLENNDSYSIFKQLDDAIITGYTGTNVNDLTLVLLEKKN